MSKFTLYAWTESGMSSTHVHADYVRLEDVEVEIARLTQVLQEIAKLPSHGNPGVLLAQAALGIIPYADERRRINPEKPYTEDDLLAIMEPCVNCRVALMKLLRKRANEKAG